MRRMISPRGVAAFVSIAVVLRLALLAFPAGGVSPWIVFALELVSLLVVGLAVLLGRVLGAGFGTVVLTAVGLALPIAGFGALADAMISREASDLAGKISLLAVGVGFCLAGPAREDRFSAGLVVALGVASLALGTKLLFEGAGMQGAAAVASPYLAAALVALVLRPLVPRPLRTEAKPVNASEAG